MVRKIMAIYLALGLVKEIYDGADIGLAWFLSRICAAKNSMKRFCASPPARATSEGMFRTPFPVSRTPDVAAIKSPAMKPP